VRVDEQMAIAPELEVISDVAVLISSEIENLSDQVADASVPDNKLDAEQQPQIESNELKNESHES